ncbi:hypothetical protein FHW96_000246 [Novosphingobium sp. SG751A]|uniref:hypothetical protein n=1 Tax=Novosphingobium sp. SG751A TaxID=2587000 RepID=UPI001551E5FC|nr:hypothetical protein [Novosphingobium sp. SG751A]NOW44119.1 hypothetical protein [Novosphingobium sp. SG751A]
MQAIQSTLPFPYRATRAAAQADSTLANGAWYVSDETGVLKMYSKTSSSASVDRGAVSTPGYTDRLKPRTVIPTQDRGADGSGAGTTTSMAADQAGFLASVNEIVASRNNLPTGINDLFQFQNGMELDPGIYDAGDFTMADCKLWMKARIPGTVFIRIPAGKYFLTVTGQVMGMYVDGIVFMGGKGALKFTRTSTNACQNMRITNCYLANYTECGIGNSSADMPFLKVDNTQLGGSGAICGIAWGGYVDQLAIKDCAIGGNDYGVAIGPRLSANYNLDTIDFIGNRKADIWLKPNIDGGSGLSSVAGWGAGIKRIKYGNELQTSGSPYPRILIANEDTSDSTKWRGSYPPLTSGAGSDAGFLILPTIMHNHINQISPWYGPFIRSYISNLQYGLMENNKFNGGTNTYFIEFPNGRTANYTNSNSHFIFREGDGSVPTAFSTHVIGRMEDHASFWPGDPSAIPVYPVSDNPNLKVIGNGLGPSLRTIYGTGTTTAVADPYGGMDFEIVTATNTNSGAGKYISLDGTNLASGGMIFVEIALQQAPTHSVSRVLIELVNYSSPSVWAFQRYIPLPANLGRFLLPIYVPPNANPGSWQLKCYSVSADVVSGTTDQFIIGDMIVNSGGGRIGRDKALTRWPVAPRNQTMLGGAQSTWPTGWSQANLNGLAGLTTTINSVGVDADGDYIEVAVSGTTSASGGWAVYLEPTRALNVVNGQHWQWYNKIKLVSGSLSTAFSGSGTDSTTGQMLMQWETHDSSDTVVGTTLKTAFTPTGTIANFGHAKWNGFNGATAWVRPYLSMTFPNSTAVSFVLRIYQPMIRRLA